MPDQKILTGVIIGFVAVLGIAFLFSESDSGIPPTPAYKTIVVQTSPWADSDTNVVSSSYQDTVYYVSDGSIEFNVTTTP